MTLTDLPLSILYTLTVDRFYYRLAGGGGGREKCLTSCIRGGGIDRKGEQSGEICPGEICLGGKCPDPPYARPQIGSNPRRLFEGCLPSVA